jgi:hypothetical protein
VNARDDVRATAASRGSIHSIHSFGARREKALFGATVAARAPTPDTGRRATGDERGDASVINHVSRTRG